MLVVLAGIKTVTQRASVCRLFPPGAGLSSQCPSLFVVAAAIEAMKNAHRSELEKELEKARKTGNNTENADIEEIRRQHEYVITHPPPPR